LPGGGRAAALFRLTGSPAGAAGAAKDRVARYDPSAMSNAESEPATEATEAKPPPFTTLVLVRHGVTEETGPILSGRRPGIGLSDKGRRQAEAAGQRLAGLPVAAVYAIPLDRCRPTADSLAAHHGLVVEAVPGPV